MNDPVPAPPLGWMPGYRPERIGDIGMDRERQLWIWVPEGLRRYGD